MVFLRVLSPPMLTLSKKKSIIFLKLETVGYFRGIQVSEIGNLFSCNTSVVPDNEVFVFLVTLKDDLY
jgi:hypothetical protein